MFGSATQNTGFGSTNQPATNTFGASAGGQPSSNGFSLGGNLALNMFGQNTNKTPSSGGGLFGNAGASNSTGQLGFGFSLGGQNANNSASSPFGAKPAATNTGLFGNTANNASNSSLLFGGAPKSSGTFGSGAAPFLANASTNANAPPTGGLFGNSAAATNQASSGLFGNKAATAPASGGLFGNTAAAKPATGGLFGGTTSSFGAPQTNTSTLNSSTFSGQNNGGMFGGLSNTQTSGSLLGANSTTSNPSGGLFGAKPATGGLFSGSSSLFGGQQQQQQQQQAQQAQPQLTAMTRFGDLPQDLKNELTQLDAYINQQHLIAVTLNGDLKKHDALVKSIPTDINFLISKLSSIKQALRFDSEHLQALKTVNDELTNDISNMMQLIVQLSTPGTKLSSSFQLHEFFAQKIKKYKETMDSYEVVINESVDAISGLEKVHADKSGNIFSLVNVVKNQYQLFMELCEAVAQIHNEVNKIQSR